MKYIFIIFILLAGIFLFCVPHHIYAQVCGGSTNSSCNISPMYRKGGTGFYVTDPSTGLPTECVYCQQYTYNGSGLACGIVDANICGACVPNTMYCEPYNFIGYYHDPQNEPCYTDVILGDDFFSNSGNCAAGQHYCTSGCVDYCDSSPSYGSCTGLSEPYNTCGTAYGTQSCTYTQPQACTFKSCNSRSCSDTYNNCDVGAGYSCPGSGTCTKTMGGKVTNSETGNPIANVYVNSTHGFDTTDPLGNYRIGGFPYNTGFTFDPTNLNTPCTSGYLCSGGSSPSPATRTGTVGGSGDCGTNCNFTYTPGHIAGHVYIDNNHDGNFDSGTDTAAPNITVTASGPTKSDVTDANGAYDISYLNDGSHTVTITVPNGYITNNGSKTITIGPNNYGVDFFITPIQLSGYMWVDYNHNAVKDAEDIGYSGGNVAVDSTSFKDTTDNTGFYSIVPNTSGTYTVRDTVPAGYAAVNGDTTNSVTISYNNPKIRTDFFITPLFNIAGIVYNDFDSGNCYNPSSHGCTDKTTNPDTAHGAGIDTPYTAGSSTVTITGNGVNQSLAQSDGTYDSGQVLKSGTYTVSFTTLPTNYHMTYPSGSIPPSFTVTVGTPGKSTACSVGTYNDAACDGWGSVTNLNFGMNNEIIWGIHPCTDVRDEIVTQNYIPPTASCGGNTQKYDIQTNSACVDPGIYASGAVTPDFGAGSANANNWIVGGATPENFSPVNPGVIRTSVSYLLTTIKNNALPTIDLSSVCTTNNCYLPSNLPDGIYTYPYDVTIAGTHDAGTGTNTSGTYTFPTGKNYVFIIGNTTNNSSLTFKSKILVPNGSTVTFASSKDMYVDPTVGESTITSTAPDIEGFYSADEDFVVQSAYVNSNRCTDSGGTRDLRFNLIGSIVAGAGNTGGTFTNQRDLCFGDISCPVTSTGGGNNGSDSTSGSTDGDNLFLTYILNAPEVIKHKNTFWQELAP